MRDKALCQPQYKIVTVDRRRKALGQGEQNSRPLVCIERDPLGMLKKDAICIRLSPHQQPAVSMSPPCRALKKSLGHGSAVSSMRTQPGSSCSPPSLKPSTVLTDVSGSKEGAICYTDEETEAQE